MYIYVYTLYFIVLCFYVQHLSVYPNAKSMLSYQIFIVYMTINIFFTLCIFVLSWTLKYTVVHYTIAYVCTVLQ